ncbi:hypothetical protein Ddye_009827 [Dipteronia dyeriana]|uniref:Uncharacterized protein n=1 Tax=Dipteronia dyeriana TaxID=168575 RepID=A0AAD9XC46_9ROSI|nr:hypothetical protein Ddye_009827 [Dipteronia dyeriana]
MFNASNPLVYSRFIFEMARIPLYTRGLDALNIQKVGLLEMARIPLKKRSARLKKREREEQQEEVKAYVLTKEETILVYRRKSQKEEDYASWPIMLEAPFKQWKTEVLKTNLGEEGQEKEVRKQIREEERKDTDSAERKGKLKGVLKLGVSVRYMQ